MSDISNVRSFTKNKNKICKLEINLNNWRTHPYNRVAFSNIEKILPISIIKKGNNSVRFKNKFEDLKTLTFLNKYKEHQSLKEYLKKNLTDTFLVIKKGNKVFEWLSENQNSNKPHILFSISKSLTGLIAGVLIEKRLIDESKNITFYIPEIKNSAYDNASIRNLLDMTVSSNFQEEYLPR